MSGTPKYSRARLRGQRAQQLERERQVRAAEEAMQREAIAAAERARLAAQRQAEADEARRSALEALDAVRAQLSALAADSVVQAWCAGDVDAVVRQLAAGEAALAAGDAPTARAVAGQAEASIADLLGRAQARQLEEETRAAIVSGMVAALAQQGFQVGAPALARVGDYESEVVIRAVRPDRRGLVVQVPVDGVIQYVVDGEAIRQEVGPDGQPASTCDETEVRLEALHRQLAAEFGVEMGELTWAGKPPGRKHKGAKDLPGGGRTARSQGGHP